MAPLTDDEKKLVDAIWKGNPVLVRKQLDKLGSEVEVLFSCGINERWNSPYILAMNGNSKGCLEIIRLLNNHGLDINRQAWYKSIPIVFAAEKQLLEVVQFFLEHGADVNVCDGAGVDAMFWAINKNNIELFELLVSFKSRLDNRKGSKDTENNVLFQAVEKCPDDTQIVRRLLELNVSPNAAKDSNSGRFPLHIAVIQNHVNATLQLITHGANVNAVDNESYTPLHQAACTFVKNLEITKLLVENGAILNACDHRGRTPLAQTLEMLFPDKDFEVSKYLIRHGSDCNSSHVTEAFAFCIKTFNDIKLLRFGSYSGICIGEIDYEIPDEDLQRDQQICVDHIRNFQSSVWSLSDICRKVIRQHLININGGVSIYAKVKSLPLPITLVPYILLENIE